MTIAQTILQQLGGNRFSMMTGAKNFSTNGNDLSFAVGRNAGKVTHVKITLEASDTYAMQFLNCNIRRIKEVASRELVYCDQLPAIFESVTGLCVSL